MKGKKKYTNVQKGCKENIIVFVRRLKRVYEVQVNKRQDIRVCDNLIHFDLDLEYTGWKDQVKFL